MPPGPSVGGLPRGLDDYTMRQEQITNIVIPLRQHASNLAQIAQVAYTQGGTDLLRLLDARKLNSRPNRPGSMRWPIGNKARLP